MALPATVLFCIDFISASLSLSLPKPQASSMLFTCTAGNMGLVRYEQATSYLGTSTASASPAGSHMRIHLTAEYFQMLCLQRTSIVAYPQAHAVVLRLDRANVHREGPPREVARLLLVQRLEPRRLVVV